MVINTVGQASLAGLCAAFTLPTMAAPGIEGEKLPAYDFNIPAQDLHAALQAVALTSNHRLFHPAQITKGIVSSELNAHYTVQQALGALLEGTGLTYEITPSEVILVRKQPEYRPESPSLRSAIAALLAVFAAQAIPPEARAQERGDTLEEIIVTAERQEMSVQKSSISIQAITGEALAQVSRSLDLMNVAPGIQVSSMGINPQVFIRGVGSGGTTSRGAVGVAFNVDGVPFPRPQATTTQYFDLARIEVLKGPQGTLYGRNVTGGAVNLITQRPQLGEFSGYFEANVGNYNLKSGEGAVNIPVGETVAMRLSGQVIDREGYLSNGGQDQKTESGRLRVLWEPNDGVSLLLNGDMSHIGGQGSGAVNIAPYHQDNPWLSNTQANLYPFQFGPGTLPFTTPNDSHIDSDISGVSAELNVDLGFATLTVLPTYRRQEQFIISYNANFRLTETLDATVKSFETRLSDTTERYSWVAGAFWYQDGFNILDANQQGNFVARELNPTIESKAVFGQARATVAPNLRLIGGLRYTEEVQDGTFRTGTAGPPIIPFTPTTPYFSYDIDSKRTNWKVGAEYDVAATSMLYATVSTGFRAGGYSPTTGCGASVFEPEDLKAFELGMKNDLLGNTLRVNLETFLWKYTNQQVGFVGEDNCGSRAALTVNAGESTIKGASIDVLWRATGNDTISAFLEYADGKYDDFSFVLFGMGVYVPGEGSLCSITPAGGQFFRADCSGLPSTRLPKWIAQARYEHVFDLSGGGTLTSSVTGQYAAKNWLDIGYIPNTLANSYEVVNAEIRYDPPNGRWKLTAYVNNAFNGVAYTMGTTVPVLDPSGFRYYAGNINPPRMYGLRAQVNF